MILLFYMNKHQYFYFGPFSQFAKSQFTIEDTCYSTAEQAMMHRKALLMGDEKIADRIMSAKTPKEVKALGRKCKFNQELWDKKKVDIVYQNNCAKFEQNQHLKEKLKSTTGLLVEAARNDRIWGIGYNEKHASNYIKFWGQNLLGKILTCVRDGSDPYQRFGIGTSKK